MISYILYVHQLKQRNNYDLDCIIAMNETAVWHKMISNTTVTNKGAKSFVLKTTSHEKSKVTVTLAAKVNGDKLNFISSFQDINAKFKLWKTFCNQKSLLRRINHKWLDENTTIDWIKDVLKTFTFCKRRLFSWDSFRAHLDQSDKELSKKGKIDPVIIPGGATLHNQAAEISWNKPIKD